MEENIFRHDVDLAEFTTFGIHAKTKLFAEYISVKELTRISRTPAYLENNVYHIGGGSNLLFTNNFDGLILHSAIKGIATYDKGDEEIFVIAGAGEKWTDLVDWCVERGYAGMECMAGIPGEVGASPVQNVGAYGREAKDVIFSVECFDTLSRKTVTFKNEECGFKYRDSNFKNEWKNRYYVVRVSFKLKKSEIAEYYEYGSLSQLQETLGRVPTIREVRDEVLKIRATKLPEVSQIGSAGSFFKNPVVHKNFYADEVLRRCPDVPAYKVDYRLVKIPAGWLIEHADLKGYAVGDAYVYPDNCLVIANKGNATASDVEKLAAHIKKEVNKKFGVRLYPEVNYIDSEIKVTILGTGTSKGIPEIGCDCHVCTSADSKDKRLRCSALVETMGVKLLIDASPDFRLQALKSDISMIDALLVTHIHYDHVGGLDDLRPFCLEGDIPVYARADVDADLKRRMDYCFRSDKYPGVPGFNMHIIDNQPFYIKGVKITPVEVFHGQLPIYGFRIGNFAYITDCKHIEEREKEKLKNLDVLVINALRDRDHFAHLTFEEARQLIEELKPRRVYLTHFCHEAGTHEEIQRRFGDTEIEPAYDGMEITVRNAK